MYKCIVLLLHGFSHLDSSVIYITHMYVDSLCVNNDHLKRPNKSYCFNWVNGT
jgi:hypothetical protein